MWLGDYSPPHRGSDRLIQLLYMIMQARVSAERKGAIAVEMWRYGSTGPFVLRVLHVLPDRTKASGFLLPKVLDYIDSKRTRTKPDVAKQD